MRSSLQSMSDTTFALRRTCSLIEGVGMKNWGNAPNQQLFQNFQKPGIILSWLTQEQFVCHVRVGHWEACECLVRESCAKHSCVMSFAGLILPLAPVRAASEESCRFAFFHFAVAAVAPSVNVRKRYLGPSAPMSPQLEAQLPCARDRGAQGPLLASVSLRRGLPQRHVAILAVLLGLRSRGLVDPFSPDCS